MIKMRPNGACRGASDRAAGHLGAPAARFTGRSSRSRCRRSFPPAEGARSERAGGQIVSARDDSGVRRALVEAVPNLRAFGISLCGDVDRADDLVQETLVKAWNNLGSFQEGTNLKAWLFTILRNTYFSECRKLRREVKDLDGEYSARLSVHPEQLGHGLRRFQARAQPALGRPARGAGARRCRGLLLRGGGGDLRMCGRYGEEPREPRARGSANS